MITVSTHGMLYHQDSYTLVGVWPNICKMFDSPPDCVMVRGKQRDLAFNLNFSIRDVCTIYEHRNAPDYYMLKLYYNRQAMEEWWNEAQRRL